MHDKKIAEMNAYYAHRAQWHDEYMSYSDIDTLEKRMAPIIEMFENHIVGRDVLEIACGTGNWTQAISRRARSVFATDNSEEMLTLARAKQHERDNVTFALADAYALEPLDRKLDVAVAAYWYSHIPIGMIPVFMKGLRGCLADGGRFVFFDMLYKPEFDDWPASTDGEGNRFGKRTLPDGKSFQVLKNFPSEQDLRTQLGPHAEKIECFEHSELRIWLVTGVMKG